MLSATTVSIHTDRIVNRFDPQMALGAGIDGGDEGETARVFTPRNLEAMRSAGLGALTYRLRTELAGEAWHWNPKGRFSAGDRGYWTSDGEPKCTIKTSFGYRLPRRGDTFDQANNDGYSRLTDGCLDTFWKSNPYLDGRPQWLIVDLRRPRTVDAIRIHWGDPYAARYEVQYWDGDNSPDFSSDQEGVWRTFPRGEVQGKGGNELRRLGTTGVAIQYVRFRFIASSHALKATKDPRDSIGFAIREIEVGRWEKNRLLDAVLHRRDRRQTACYVSSTDPWHRATDRDPKIEQPGLDLVARSGLTRGFPILLPATVLYGTPEDDAALAHWLRMRRYPVRGFEMGEEPDGQVCAPEDYGALYVRMADALRKEMPEVPLGGPCFQTEQTDYAAWALGPSSRTWLERLTDYLAARGRGRDLQFVSFEWYPFDAVDASAAVQLAKHAALLRTALARLSRAGRPLLMTEYGYSAFAGPAEVDLPGALLNLDLVGSFLAAGGQAAYLYGYPPAPLMEERKGAWGNLALLLSDDEGQWRQRLPTYWAARTMTQDWCGRGMCSLFKTDSMDSLVAAFGLRRADGQIAVLLVNKDPRRPHRLRLSVDERTVSSGSMVQYGRGQYAWKAAG